MTTKAEKISKAKLAYTPKQQEEILDKKRATYRKNKISRLANDKKISYLLVEMYDLMSFLHMLSSPTSTHLEHLELRQELEPNRNFTYNEMWNTLSFDYPVSELITKYGKHGLKLFRRFFTRLSSGGRTTSGESYVSRWSIKFSNVEEYNKSLYEHLKTQGKKNVTLEDKIATILTLVEMSLEYTEYVEVECQKTKKQIVVGKKGSKKVIGPVEKAAAANQRKLKKQKLTTKGNLHHGTIIEQDNFVTT